MTNTWFEADKCLGCDGIGTHVCTACSGTGCAASGNRPDDYGPHTYCTTCNGFGSVSCPVCWGDGQRAPHCDNCARHAAHKLIRTKCGLRCNYCHDPLEE